MTLVLKPDLDIIKMYVCTKNEVPTFSSSKVIIWTDRQIDGQTDTQTNRLNWNYYLPHTRMVKICLYVVTSKGQVGMKRKILCILDGFRCRDREKYHRGYSTLTVNTVTYKGSIIKIPQWTIQTCWNGNMDGGTKSESIVWFMSKHFSDILVQVRLIE